MKALIAPFIAMIFLGGCNKSTEYKAEVVLLTGESGRHISTRLSKPSGKEDVDKLAVSEAIYQFRKKVPKPVPNQVYIQPVNVLIDNEQVLFPSREKQQ